MIEENTKDARKTFFLINFTLLNNNKYRIKPKSIQNIPAVDKVNNETSNIEPTAIV